jgi:primase-polymerase (primpol)-like protein
VTDELVKEYEADVQVLERGVAAAATEWGTLARMYGENPDQMRPEQLLADIAAFVTAFNGVRKELTMTSSTPAASTVKRVEEKVDAVDAIKGQDVDDLKTQIQSGAAFEARREQRRNARGQTVRGGKFM